MKKKKEEKRTEKEKETKKRLTINPLSFSSLFLSLPPPCSCLLAGHEREGADLPLGRVMGRRGHGHAGTVQKQALIMGIRSPTNFLDGTLVDANSLCKWP